MYSADSGEEQGLYGGKIIAQYAADHGWKVEANLNNDIVGSPRGGDGQSDPHSVRVFSEGTKSNETLEQANCRLRELFLDVADLSCLSTTGS